MVGFGGENEQSASLQISWLTKSSRLLSNDSPPFTEEALQSQMLQISWLAKSSWLSSSDSAPLAQSPFARDDPVQDQCRTSAGPVGKRGRVTAVADGESAVFAVFVFRGQFTAVAGVVPTTKSSLSQPFAEFPVLRTKHNRHRFNLPLTQKARSYRPQTVHSFHSHHFRRTTQ
jgi:hypothetical protein